MTSMDNVEKRAVIKHCVRVGMTPTDTLKFMNQGNTGQSCKRSLVYKWHGRFSNGREDINDDKRAGRPVTSDSLKLAVASELSTDRRRSIDELADMFDLSHGTMHKIITNDLGMRKVSARWVPRLLSENEKNVRVETSQCFLARHAREGDHFLNKIVTCDETWLHFYDPETKAESMVWKRPSSPPPKKAKVIKSAKKVMFLVFMDHRGILLSHAIPTDKTVNAGYYQKVLRRDLVHAIKKKRSDVEIENLIFHQDNAPAHRAQETLMTIDFLGFERLNHSPYSPDLAPMDFAIFPRLKADLRGRRFECLAELRSAVQSSFASLSETWFTEVYRKWVVRHQKCVQESGEYFEKQ